MKKLVFTAIIASIAMTGCTQKVSEYDISCFDEKVTAETVELATCDINVGGIRFTKSKNGAQNGNTLLSDTIKFKAGVQTDYIHSPDGSVVNSSAVIFTEVDTTKPFTFTAKVQPGFTETGTYSAGVLYAYDIDSHCQKLCFEHD